LIVKDNNFFLLFFTSSWREPTGDTTFKWLSCVVFAADGGEVKSKLTHAGKTIQGILTGLVVLVGICVALFIIIKRMPDADDPREKSEVYHAVGRVAGLVALAAAIIWLLPWVYSLFT